MTLSIALHGTTGGGVGAARVALPVPTGRRPDGAPGSLGAGAEGRRARPMVPETRGLPAAGAPAYAGAGRNGSLAAAYAPDLRFAFGVSLAFETQRIAQAGPQEALAPPQALAVYQTADLRLIGFLGRLDPLDWRV
jgi:hypothetical protein